ncbi:hypothetical protein KY290_009923 [Solanum tuberosum]|uniref:Nucleotide-diphospho-sugar transferase domain-containing protein n=1 Tax=Solanum tuberosum TaxID=4113 RepID=A0ABQ7VXK2_SOLTU|nr:hypothetical protein KY289_010306 [Solanum tuberosum]KAH0708452.1 hypothetical protein KY284_009879 [Solanum tuberosum]KAH0772786.1 hypothetical protein KY290_009923 [Solanum tuberosum]
MGTPSSRIGAAIVIGVVVGCVFAFFYPYGFFSPNPPPKSHPLFKYDVLVESWSNESTEWMNMLRSYIRRLSKKNAELQKQVKELNEKLQVAEQEKSRAQEQLVLLGEPKKAAPFGKVKSSRTNRPVLPDESVNPRLAKILTKVVVGKEISVMKTGRDTDETVDFIVKSGGNHAMSGLKFRILREFLQLGYSVLLSDVDIVYLQNPFDHLYHDSDVEVMSNGHNNMTAYGYNDVSDEADMGWAQYTHAMRIWDISVQRFLQLNSWIALLTGSLRSQMLGTRLFSMKS